MNAAIAVALEHRKAGLLDHARQKRNHPILMQTQGRVKGRSGKRDMSKEEVRHPSRGRPNKKFWQLRSVQVALTTETANEDMTDESCGNLFASSTRNLKDKSAKCSSCHCCCIHCLVTAKSREAAASGAAATEVETAAATSANDSSSRYMAENIIEHSSTVSPRRPKPRRSDGNRKEKGSGKHRERSVRPQGSFSDALNSLRQRPRR